MRTLTFLTIVTLVCSLAKAHGQDTTTTSTPNTAGSLTISGYADAYYMYNFNHPPHETGLFQSPTSDGIENVGRIFDIKNNQFSLGLAQTKFSYTKGRLTGVIDLTYGPNAVLGNFGNVIGGGDLFIKQAYLDYMVNDKLKFTIGQFGTHVGYELIDAPLNFNYSLSYLFGNGPFYHTGAKLAYSFSKKFGVMGGIVNGWDEMFDFNKKKSFISQVYIAPKDGFSIYLNWVGGDEKNGLSFPTIANADSAKTPSNIFDLTTTYQLNKKLKLGLNAAYGTGKLIKDTASHTVEKYNTASWYGAAVYINYSIKDNFALGLRAEHFNDKDGVRYITAATGVATSYNEVTLTGDIKWSDGMFNIKPEIRLDVAGKDVFGKFNSDGKFDKMTSTQLTIGSAFIFKF